MEVSHCESIAYLPIAEAETNMDIRCTCRGISLDLKIVDFGQGKLTTFVHPVSFEEVMYRIPQLHPPTRAKVSLILSTHPTLIVLPEILVHNAVNLDNPFAADLW